MAEGKIGVREAFFKAAEEIKETPQDIQEEPKDNQEANPPEPKDNLPKEMPEAEKEVGKEPSEEGQSYDQLDELLSLLNEEEKEPEPKKGFDVKNLPPELQEVYKSMQADYTRKTQALAEERRELQRLRDEYERLKAELEAKKEYGFEEYEENKEESEIKHKLNKMEFQQNITNAVQEARKIFPFFQEAEPAIVQAMDNPVIQEIISIKNGAYAPLVLESLAYAWFYANRDNIFKKRIQELVKKAKEKKSNSSGMSRRTTTPAPQSAEPEENFKSIRDAIWHLAKKEMQKEG